MAMPAWVLPASMIAPAGVSASGGKKGGGKPAPSPLERQLAQQGQQIMEFSTSLWPGWQEQFSRLLGIPIWRPTAGPAPQTQGGSQPKRVPFFKGMGRVDKFGDLLKSALVPQEQQGYWETPAPWDPREHPAYQSTFALGKQALESQYGQARERVLSGTAPGGQLLDELARLERERASSVGQLPFTIGADLAQQMLNYAYQAAFGLPTTGVQATGSAAGLATDRALAGARADMYRSQIGAQFASELGEALGTMAVLKYFS